MFCNHKALTLLENEVKFIPYGRHMIDADDIDVVVDVLRSDFLTTGPCVAAFEEAVCMFTGATYGVAMCNGTAALHAAMYALGVGKGDEVIVPPITFVATANAALYCGGTPVFVDVDEATCLIDASAVEAAITPRTKVIVGVDYAGQPCDWDALRTIAKRHGIALVADACHALGASYKGRSVGTLADITVLSFHPVKHITTGEGGMAVTCDAALADKMRHFCGHGITTTAAERERVGAWYYEMQELGCNYRITDIQCALGVSQLKKLPVWLTKRYALAQIYDKAFTDTDVRPLLRRSDVFHAYHLYVVRVKERDVVFKALRQKGIGVNVHYMPVYLHPYYQELGYKQGLCPVAERVFTQMLTLPLWAGLEEESVGEIVNNVFIIQV